MVQPDSLDRTSEPSIKRPERPARIVGVGASAGGVEALEGLLRPMPADTELAFVIITHLAVGHVSALPEILARFTRMPIVPITDGCRIDGGCIYVLGARALVTIDGGELHLHPGDAPDERNPVDIFLASLARDQGENAIGVILSGGGSDGSMGIKAIKERCGLTIAQGADGTAPKFDGMPSSAISTGLVDFVLSAEDIGSKLVDYVRSSNAFDSLVDLDGSPGETKRLDALRLDICQIIRQQIGHDFSGYKERTFMRRVQRRMQVLQIAEPESFVARLRADPEQVSLLFRDLLIGVTEFFRDIEPFRILAEKVIPALFEGKTAADTIRIWVPGCTTGEEVYSLAILMREHMAGLIGAPKVKLFATDIDDEALAIARLGRYPATMLGGVSVNRLEQFFVGDGISYSVAKNIRDLCVFSSHSVIRDPPFSRMDLISCRNLLIYLNNDVQRQLIPLFHYALRPGGYLFLGTSESIAQHADLFAPLEKAQRIFQRREAAVSAKIPFPAFMSGAVHSRKASEASPGDIAVLLPRGLRHTVESRVLERFAPAHVVVNSEGDIVYYSSRTGRYIEAVVGSPSRHLVTMARRGLRAELRTCLRRAMETGRPVEVERLQVEQEDRVQFVTLRVEPLAGQDINEPLFLVLFSDEGEPVTPEELANATLRHDDSNLAEIERQLTDTRERLQAMIEEYETGLEELKSANEELVSVNEELQSTNEELETSKEETQSINEELHTVNVELAHKVEELDRANIDLKNLFESTQIATIFVDSGMMIRTFTPAVTGIFSLILSDKGRPITDIANRLADMDLTASIHTVMRNGQFLEDQVSARDGQTHFLMRIVPYRIGGGIIDGVLITFIDVTGLVCAEDHQRLLVGELNHRVRNMLQVVSSLANQTAKRSPSLPEFSETYLGRVHALAAAYELLSDRNWGSVMLRDLVLREVMPQVVGEDRLKVVGPPISLTPKATLAFSLILHELATNAVKHGACSTPVGRIDVSWSLDAANSFFVFDWRELNGPPPAGTGRVGGGSELVANQISYELDGTLDLRFLDTGLAAKITVPVDKHLFSMREIA